MISERAFVFQFSALSVLVTYLSLQKFIQQSQLLAIANWHFPASVISPSSTTTYWALFAFILIGFIACPFLKIRLAKPLLAILWLFLLSFEFSFGKIDHAKHGFFFVALGFLLGSLPQFLVAGAVAQYFSSGLWKLRALLGDGSFWENASNNLPHHFAYAIAEGSSNHLALLMFANDNKTIMGLLWLGVIAMQIGGSTIAVIHATKRPFIVLLFIGFHYASSLTMGIMFFPQILLLAWMIYFLKFWTRLEVYKHG